MVDIQFKDVPVNKLFIHNQDSFIKLSDKESGHPGKFNARAKDYLLFILFSDDQWVKIHPMFEIQLEQIKELNKAKKRFEWIRKILDESTYQVRILKNEFYTIHVKSDKFSSREQFLESLLLILI